MPSPQLIQLLADRSDLRGMQADALLTALKGFAWKTTLSEFWITSMTLVSRLGADAVPVLTLLDAINAGTFVIPGDTGPVYTRLIIEARASLRANGIDECNPLARDLVLLLRGITPTDRVPAATWDTIIGWVWTYAPAYDIPADEATALTADDLTSALDLAGRLVNLGALEAALASRLNESVAPTVSALRASILAGTAATVPTLADLLA